MRMATLGLLIAFTAGALADCAGGGGGGGAAVPGSASATTPDRTNRVASPSPTPVSGGTAPKHIQQFTYTTSALAGEAASTVPLGSSGSAGVAPAAGHLLVAFVTLDDNGGSPVVTAPAGWTSVPGSALDVAWTHHRIETFVVGSAAPPSVTFSYNESAGAIITIVEVANTSGIGMVTSATGNVNPPWSTSTGSSSQSASGNLGIAVFSIVDAILTPGSLSGYTLLSGTGRHGDGLHTFGHTSAVYAAATTAGSGGVPAQNISWAQGSGTEGVIGQQVLLAPAGVTTALLPAPTTAPTSTPTVTPSPKPTATTPPPSGSASFTNAVDSPTSFVPYASNSIWDTPVSASPKYLSNSAAIVAAQFPNGQNPEGMRVTEAGAYDYAHPVYYATSSDPLINLVCNQYCGSYSATMRIPAKARPAGGNDAHIAVVQPDGTEIDAWAAYGSPGSNPAWDAPHDMQTRDWQNGDTLTAGNVSTCGSYVSGSGLANPPAATAADFCLRGGIVTAAEILSGQINHALFVAGQCAIGIQYPAPPGAGTQQCTSGLGPPLGGRVWYDVPCATTRANTALYTWEKAILCALNVYGAYFGDNGSGGAYYTGGIAPMFESEEPWRDWNGNGYTSPFAALASQGWAPMTISNAIGSSTGYRWVYNNLNPWNPTGVNFPAHIHWLAPCSAQGTC